MMNNDVVKHNVSTMDLYRADSNFQGEAVYNCLDCDFSS